MIVCWCCCCCCFWYRWWLSGRCCCVHASFLITGPMHEYTAFYGWKQDEHYRWKFVAKTKSQRALAISILFSVCNIKRMLSQRIPYTQRAHKTVCVCVCVRMSNALNAPRLFNLNDNSIQPNWFLQTHTHTRIHPHKYTQ